IQLMKATVSAFAVAVALLAAGTTAIAQDQGDQQSKPASIAQAAPTAADAEAFVKQAEKELFDFSILTSRAPWRSYEHTSELQSLMSKPSAVFCFKQNTYT